MGREERGHLRERIENESRRHADSERDNTWKCAAGAVAGRVAPELRRWVAAWWK